MSKHVALVPGNRPRWAKSLAELGTMASCVVLTNLLCVAVLVAVLGETCSEKLSTAANLIIEKPWAFLEHSSKPT